MRYTLLREQQKRKEPQKYIFKDGKVRKDNNPFALLNRPERDSATGGVVLMITPPEVDRKLKKGNP